MAETEQQSGSTSEDETPKCAFMVPKKEISMVPDMGKWKRSQAYADYMGFIMALNESVKRKKLTCDYHVSEEAEALVSAVLPADKGAASAEIAVYLKESVGNSTRIDYGTGHEAAFAAFLCCLCKVGALTVEDQLAMVFKVFDRYLEVMRKLQKTYRMEPAGSQGVWGLDDFQFLPFIWGSSQLVDHPTLEPRHFVDERAVNEHHHDYMFLECIKFINEMKTGPFAEHSNQLWNISAVPSWAKVNQGLIRMYKAECLEKFPVIQHFKFGSLLSIQPVAP
uniref:Serine/threonine-protein phosphatase 2A activator n=1 Tax=Cynoglossus semilaevis TaxID=244447 RepID=A0A3P8WP13_CYNSE